MLAAGTCDIVAGSPSGSYWKSVTVTYLESTNPTATPGATDDPDATVSPEPSITPERAQLRLQIRLLPLVWEIQERKEMHRTPLKKRLVQRVEIPVNKNSLS